MRNHLSAEQLASSVIQVLESAAFVFAERIDEAPWPVATAAGAHVTLEHGDQARLTLCVAPTLGTVLAANLLGLEPDSEEARTSAADAVAELANMLAGVLAVELFGRDVTTRIGVPRLVEESAADHEQHLAAATCRVALLTEEGERIDVTLAPPSAPPESVQP